MKTEVVTLSPNIVWGNRIALFVVLFWFGFLKVIGMSPAEAIVTQLHHKTIEFFISIENFLPLLGITECTIGILWLFPKATKPAFFLFCLQMFTTFFPLILMPNETWKSTLALSLSGQYIIKNVVLVASAYTVFITYSTLPETEVNP